MYIGEVAKKTGLSIKAIRLYEEKGLITAPPRKGRYRVYSDAQIDVLNLIKETKLLGASLSQIKGAIVYNSRGGVDWSRIEAFLVDIKQQLLRKIEGLESQVKSVDQCLSEIDTCPLNVDSAPKGRD